ncbi:MAG TPA: ATP-binding protein [Vicinamibacterales bacterium]|jgi:signal transduction histidine kinase|nr:ATP-binding protein [Vicinamibacterales bacterium]
MHPRLLVVDDEARQMEALCRTLTPEGYDVTGFSVPEEALAALREQPFDVLLTDLMMPGMDGLALMAAALEIDPDLVGIMMTGQGTVTSAVDAMKIGALDYILKPFNLTAIRPVLARAIDVRRLRLDNIRLREAVSLYEVSNTIARSLDSESVLARVADAALEQSRAHEVGVYVLHASGSELRLAASRGREGGSQLAPFLSAADPLVAAALRGREQLLGGGERPEELRSTARSAWQHPIAMVVDGRLIGLLVCRVTTPQRPMPAGQIKSLSVLAGTAATALEASMLLEHLRRSNDDLRKFAWAASHDLQEPLRDIALQTQLLERRQGAFDAESRELAQAAADSARRILRLVQELRTFVEAGHVSIDGAATADGNAALDRALTDLRRAIADTQTRLDRGPLPVVRMREGDLAEVFRRLLDNAIKFRRPGSAPQIQVAAAQDNGQWVFSVVDAGIGIDPSDHAQIFELFQRVNRREEYDGIGMGLPVCRRLVEAYGGRVWVESRAGEGARFYVSLPGSSSGP